MTVFTPYLNQSIKGVRWSLPAVNDHDVQRLMQTQNLPELLARLMIARGLPTENVDAFLSPTLARDFPDPARLTDMSDAAAFIADLVQQNKTIGIFADFDVDGATSSALLIQFFRALNIKTFIHIPDRMNEGYGPNTSALFSLRDRGADAILICDCGITAHDILAPVTDTGFPIIILDHHEPEATLPPATFIIDPKRNDDTSGYTMLCTAGLAFLFCVAINRALRANGFYTRTGITEPPLKNWLDLVAVGTICDMVPLTGPNRLFVRFGLPALSARQNVGLAALARLSKIKDEDPITVMNIGFGLGPRINAGSRVHEADLGSRLLSSTDEVEAMRLAEILNECNTKRREIEQATVAHALKIVEEQGLDTHPVIIVDHENWHPGVAGLVATRLKDKYNKPVAVVTYAKRGDGEIEARGSGRSVKGFNIATLFQNAKAAGHLIKGGGHAMAGGFSLRPEQLTGFKQFVRDEGARLSVDIDPTPEQTADSLAFVRTLNVATARILSDQLGPYGMEHQEPLFIVPNVRIAKIDVIGVSHLRAMITDIEGGPSVKAMAFRQVGTELGMLLQRTADRPVHLLGRLNIDRWQGRETPVLMIEDAAVTS